MSLVAGAKLGSYEIIGPLGAGGMGHVYRARDPRLDREVAIKVLPVDTARDPGALARFEREAMSVAKLSHPNILSIFEFAHDGDTSFVVTELVDGETLRARLERGPLPARRAVAYALQIARGIGAAHTRAIVHRDLKPENVMITHDDHVKILDFGLAKPFDIGDADMTRAGHTSAGTILGTVGYMAPEQVRGLTVDHRADIFAFGALLYEMLSGERAFTGDTAADSMSAILTRDPPDLDAARLSLPAGLERIVRRCLEKSPDLRFQSATDLAFALESFAAPSSAASGSSIAVEAPRQPAATTQRSVSWVPWAIAVLALGAAVVIWFAKAAAPAAELRWNSFTRITESAGEETAPAISPDGGTVAYAVHVGTSWDIYAQRVGGRNAAPILSDPDRDEGAPAFSPDGSRLAFHVSTGLGGIFVAGATGESVRRVTDTGFDPAWSPDGKQIAFASEGVVLPSVRNTRSTLFVVDAGGGTPRPLVQGDAVQPAWSPSGRRIVYWSNSGADGSIDGNGQRDIYTVAAAGGERVPVTRDAAIDWSPVWSPDGRFVYFASDRGGVMNLWRIAVDEESGRVLGAPEPVTTGVSGAIALPRFSKDGSRLAFRSRVAAINPVAIPFDPASLRAGAPVLLDSRSTIRVPSDVSPDGKLVAFYSIGETQEDLFVGPPEGPLRRVTDDAIRDRSPMFSRDGKSLLFYSTRDGDWAAWAVGIDGGGLRKVAPGPDGGLTSPILSPKGDTIAFATLTKGAFTAAFHPEPGGAPIELPGTLLGTDYFLPSDWEDGTRLIGRLLSASGDSLGVAVYDLASHTLTKLTDGDNAITPRWLADGRRVLYFEKGGRELVVLNTLTRVRSVVDVHLPAPAARDSFTISPDNRTIYYGAERTEADIWLVERK